MVRFAKLTKDIYMKKAIRIITCLCLPVLFSARTKITYAQLSTDSVKYILKREVDNRRSAGIIVGLIDEKGRQIVSYGNVKEDSNQQPDSSTLYEIGSVTKVFTSLLLADMVKKGEVKLDDPISKFLPKSVKTPVRKEKEITLLDLATHRSGLPRYPDNESPKNPNNPYTDYTVEQLYDFLSNYTLERDIGSKYQYSNYGYGLLGHILELKAGINYETLVKQRICAPLKMSNTVITLTPELQSRFAKGHEDNLKTAENWDMPALAGAGALRSTVNDLLNFASANLGLTETKLAAAIELTHQTHDGRTRTHLPDLNVALAWHIWKTDLPATTQANEQRPGDIIWQNGRTGGYNAFIGFDKMKKTGIVVLSNSSNDIDDIALHILEKRHQLNPYHYPWLLKDTVSAIMNEKGIDAAIELYHSLKKEKNTRYTFNEEQLNTLGWYELLTQAKKVNEAIAILKLNAQEYPGSWNVYDSLGAAYAENGDTELAIANYEKSISLNPANTNGLSMLKKLKNK